ncbi:MAG: fumarylacetoacetate hydrolase family protein [Tissierellia bacterium]|nr:fumarylacetoacetate hydrolase family protein [Tissierellia bacterium]
MKFLRFENSNGDILSGIIKEKKIFAFEDLDYFKEYKDILDLIKNFNVDDINFLNNLESEKYYNLENVKILPPFSSLAHDAICVGLNYHEHIEESMAYKGGFEVAPNATYFSKRSAIISGPGDDIIWDSELDDSLDYETELAIVIGKKGKDIKEEDALDYVFGFTILNDISSRILQMSHGQWFKGKSLDGYTSLGPWIVEKTEFTFPLELDISTKVNGEIRQNSNTKLMIRGIERLIYELSQGMTLFPGDIIATGTPAGVGMGFNPPKFLKDGDLVECEVEGIGVLKNRVLAKR